MSYPFSWLNFPQIYLELIKALLSFFENAEGNGRIHEGQIGLLRSYGVNPGLARPGLRWLAEQGILLQTSDADGPESHLVWEFGEEGAEFAFDYVGSGESKAAITGWDPMPVELTEAQISPVLKATDDLLERIRADNQLASSDPNLRSRLLITLEAGKTFLRSRAISSNEIRNFLLIPARWIAHEFPKAFIAIAARTLVESLAKLFT